MTKKRYKKNSKEFLMKNEKSQKKVTFDKKKNYSFSEISINKANNSLFFYDDNGNRGPKESKIRIKKERRKTELYDLYEKKNKVDTKKLEEIFKNDEEKEVKDLSQNKNMEIEIDIKNKLKLNLSEININSLNKNIQEKKEKISKRKSKESTNPFLSPILKSNSIDEGKKSTNFEKFYSPFTKKKMFNNDSIKINTERTPISKLKDKINNESIKSTSRSKISLNKKNEKNMLDFIRRRNPSSIKIDINNFIDVNLANFNNKKNSKNKGNRKKIDFLSEERIMKKSSIGSINLFGTCDNFRTLKRKVSKAEDKKFSNSIMEKSRASLQKILTSRKNSKISAEKKFYLTSTKLKNSFYKGNLRRFSGYNGTSTFRSWFSRDMGENKNEIKDDFEEEIEVTDLGKNYDKISHSRKFSKSKK